MALLSFISSETRTVRLTDNDLLEIVYFDHAHVTSANLMHDVHVFDEVVQDKKVRKLVIFGQDTVIDVDARKLAAEENRKRKSHIAAEALVVKSTTVRLAVLMYLLFLRSPYPVKIFSNRENAMAWLDDPENNF